MSDESNFLANLAKLKASNEAKGYTSLSRQQAPRRATTVPPVATPATAGTTPRGVRTLDDGAKAELRNLDLLSVYRRWFAPEAERNSGGDEVNCSCFNSSFHRGGDQNPQLGFNTVKNTYYCHACGVTGDIVDLTAVKYGFSDASWRCPDDKVHEAVKYAGEELLGMQFRLTPAGYQRIPEFTSMQVSAPSAPKLHAPAAPAAPPAQSSTAIPAYTPQFADQSGMTLGTFQLPGPDALRPNPADLGIPPYTGPAPETSEEEDEEPEIPVAFELKWRDFVPEGTPLHNYLSIVCEDDSPEEFHFWNFMSLIGLAMGRKVFIPDVKAVYGNMLLCIVGRTGQGKSRSEGYVDELIRSAMPFDNDDPYTNGVKIVKNPGSGEYLAKSFIHEVDDPTVPPGPRGQAKKITNPSVKALIRWPEMATMVGKSSSRGSIIQTTVIDLYDTPNAIGGGSLTNGTYEAQNPFGSVTTTTQLSSIRNLVTVADAGSGFLNRWWFIVGKTKPFVPWGEYVDVSPVKHDVEMLVKWAEGKFARNSGYQTLTPEAKDAAGEYLIARCAPLEADESDEMLRRAVLSFKKLVLLFSANMMESEISVDAVEQAKIAFEYLILCMRHIGARVGQTDFEIATDAILDLIRKSGHEGVTGRDIRVKIRKVTKQPLDQVNSHIRGLELAGMIELRTIPKIGPGRPTKRYFLAED